MNVILSVCQVLPIKKDIMYLISIIEYGFEK